MSKKDAGNGWPLGNTAPNQRGRGNDTYQGEHRDPKDGQSTNDKHVPKHSKGK